MAIKFAGTIDTSYQVYDHQPPVFVGKDRTNEDQYRANLVPVCVITAKTKDEAWEKANNLCIQGLPVLEVIGNVQ